MSRFANSVTSVLFVEGVKMVIQVSVAKRAARCGRVCLELFFFFLLGLGVFTVGAGPWRCQRRHAGPRRGCEWVGEGVRTSRESWLVVRGSEKLRSRGLTASDASANEEGHAAGCRMVFFGLAGDALAFFFSLCCWFKPVSSHVIARR